jgi:uncharacterized protein (TIGR03790 family)
MTYKITNNLYYFILFLAIVLMPFIANSQENVRYDDVAVIVNKNDAVSKDIGNYFKTKRNIPDKNVIYVNVPSEEEVNDSVFFSMRKQIENYLVNKKLDNKINYLVTTKGCPLKILRFYDDKEYCNASVDNELTLILGKYKKDIGNCGVGKKIFKGSVRNPYLHQTDNFSHEKYDIYLVTRLDAHTKEGVYQLIDRSGPNTYADKNSVLFVFDEAPNWSFEKVLNNFSHIAKILNERGWKTLVNSDSVFVTGRKNVIGYQSWGSNDKYYKHYTDTSAQPYFTWAGGSIAETMVSTSGRSFRPGTHYGQSLIADLIKEGVTGAKGYVYEPESEAIANPNILWDRYTATDEKGYPKYNLAESYYAASRFLGWTDVVIGDPKASITGIKQ